MSRHFGMRQALQPQLNKGYGSLALIERQCFQGQFQDISSKLYLMEAIIRPTVLYGAWRTMSGILRGSYVEEGICVMTKERGRHKH